MRAHVRTRTRTLALARTNINTGTLTYCSTHYCPPHDGSFLDESQQLLEQVVPGPKPSC